MLLVLSALAATGQKQLVLINREKVILRLYPGDEIRYRLKGESIVRTSYINNLFDTAVVAHKDIVPFHTIDRIYWRHRSFANRVGGVLTFGGAAYFLVDQFNEVIVHGHDATINENVAVTSAAMVAVGLPLWLIKKKSQRLGGRFRLLTVGPNSLFYLRELDHF